MVGNILKVIVVLILGSLFGLIFGAITGALFGTLPGLFFLEIINFNQTIFMSIGLGAFLGGLYGLCAIKLVNRFLEVNYKSFYGVIFGIIVGVTVTLRTGIITSSMLDASETSVIIIPVFYSELLGIQIAPIVFAIVCAAGFIKSMIENLDNISDNKQKIEEIKKSLGMNSSERERG